GTRPERAAHYQSPQHRHAPARTVLGDQDHRVAVMTSIIVALASAVLLGVGQQGGATDATEVLALEQKIEAAVVRGDVAFVSSVLSDDFHFVHGDGWTTGGKPLMEDDKAAFLKRVADREYAVHDLDHVRVEMHGDVAITYGRYVSLFVPKNRGASPG